MESIQLEIRLKAKRTMYGSRADPMKLVEDVKRSLEDLMLTDIEVEVKELGGKTT